MAAAVSLPGHRHEALFVPKLSLVLVVDITGDVASVDAETLFAVDAGCPIKPSRLSSFLHELNASAAIAISERTFFIELIIHGY